MFACAILTLQNLVFIFRFLRIWIQCLFTIKMILRGDLKDIRLKYMPEEFVINLIDTKKIGEVIHKVKF